VSSISLPHVDRFGLRYLAVTAREHWLETCAGERDHWEFADEDTDSERPRPVDDRRSML